MIHIPQLRTRRLTLQLRELSIGDSLAVLAIPGHLEQATTTEFLRRSVSSVKGIDDPAAWTVQERAMATAHYLASASDDGPDFSLGEGKYSDYLDAAKDYQTATVSAGELGGDIWLLRQLTGAMAESIERLQGEIEGISGRLHWMIGAMAAQLVRDGDPAIDGDDVSIDEQLTTRMRVLIAYPESDFVTMLAMFQSARAKLGHLFDMDFADAGIVFLPKGGDEAAVTLPPARFPAHSCISAFARGVVGQS